MPSGIQLMEGRCSSTAVSNSASGPVPTSEHYLLSGKSKEKFFWAARNLNTVKYSRICLTARIIISRISSGWKRLQLSSWGFLVAVLISESSCAMR